MVKTCSHSMIVMIERNPLLLTRTCRSKSAICIAFEFRKKNVLRHVVKSCSHSMIVMIARNPPVVTRTRRSKSAISVDPSDWTSFISRYPPEPVILVRFAPGANLYELQIEVKASKSSSKLLCHFFVSMSLLRLERAWLSPRLGAAAEATNEMAFKHKAHSR